MQITELKKLIASVILVSCIATALHAGDGATPSPKPTKRQAAIAEVEKQATQLDLKQLRTNNLTSWTPNQFEAKWRAHTGKVVKLKFNHLETTIWSINEWNNEKTFGLCDSDRGCVPVIYPDSASDFIAKLPTTAGPKNFFIYGLVMNSGAVYLLGRDIQPGKGGLIWTW